jgi:nitrate/nitrite transport system substrate-binding protein
MTFPGGTHDVWLRYWLDAAGVDRRMRKIIPIPPPQMVAHMTAGNVDGYCVGEPWNAVAARHGLGFTAIATQDIWENHPEKSLVVNAAFAQRHRKLLKRLMAALLDACRFADDAANIPEVASSITGPGRIKAEADEIEGRLIGEYDLGLGFGDRVFGHRRMRFFRGGEVNAPRVGHAIWFLTQFHRLGYLDEPVDAHRLAREYVLGDIYSEVASEAGVDVPDDGMRPFELKLDGSVFDPADPEREPVRI